MRVKTEQWLRALAAAVITGAASSGSAFVGIAVAAAVGVNVQRLDLKQLGVMCLTGGLVGMFAYLKQSPVPPESTGDTEMTKKDTK
jgi:hypothetical protein